MVPGTRQDTAAVTAPPPCRTSPSGRAGAPGTVAAVTALLAADSGPVPTAFTARTRKVYVVPWASPVTTALVTAPGTVTVRCTVVPTMTWTLDEVTGEPPLPGWVQVTFALRLPRVAVTAVGAGGAEVSTTGLDSAEGVPGPLAFTACTWKV